METPFDKAYQDCKNFAWNLLSSVQVLNIHEKLGKEKTEEEEIAYQALLENHCKYLSSEVIH